MMERGRSLTRGMNVVDSASPSLVEDRHLSRIQDGPRVSVDKNPR